MIKYFQNSNIFESKSDVLVNTVNTVGVMGKGLALSFKTAFPYNFFCYKGACQRGEVKIGKMFIVKDSSLIYGEKTIINFPTKEHWKFPSRYEYIEKGLIDLKRVIIEQNIKNIAIPPLGCGLGGLDWKKVKLMIEKELSDLENVEIEIYEP